MADDVVLIAQNYAALQVAFNYFNNLRDKGVLSDVAGQYRSAREAAEYLRKNASPQVLERLDVGNLEKHIENFLRKKFVIES